MNPIPYVLRLWAFRRRRDDLVRRFHQRAVELETYNIKANQVAVVSIAFTGAPNETLVSAVERRLAQTLGFTRLHWDSKRSLLVATR